MEGRGEGGCGGRQRRGTDERDKVSARKSQADGRGAQRFTQKAQTGLIRNSSNPSMMLTGGQAHRKDKLRRAERLTKTSPSGLGAQRIKQRLRHHVTLSRIPVQNFNLKGHLPLIFVNSKEMCFHQDCPSYERTENAH